MSYRILVSENESDLELKRKARLIALDLDTFNLRVAKPLKLEIIVTEKIFLPIYSHCFTLRNYNELIKSFIWLFCVIINYFQ